MMIDDLFRFGCVMCDVDVLESCAASFLSGLVFSSLVSWFLGFLMIMSGDDYSMIFFPSGA